MLGDGFSLAPAFGGDFQAEGFNRLFQQEHFGGIAIRAGGGGSVTIDPANDSASYIGVDPIDCGSGPCTPHAARFAVEGFAHRSYRVTLPGEAPISVSHKVAR